MAKKGFLQTRPFFALGIVLIVWAILPVAIKSLTRFTFYEFQAPAQLGASHLRDLQEFWSSQLHSNRELLEAGRDLARINARYEVAIRENESLRAEIQRLERFNFLPSREGFRYEVARVVRRDFSAWWQQIIIRKGANYSITVGAPVIFVGGVVGTVREVGPYTAIVDLISSPNVRLAASFDGDNRPVAFQGITNDSFTGPRGIVRYVPQDTTASPEAPLLLVTSGLGGVFPPGLPIGRVHRLGMGPDGQFKTGDVLLDERLGGLTEVAVLVRTAN